MTPKLPLGHSGEKWFLYRELLALHIPSSPYICPLSLLAEGELYLSLAPSNLGILPECRVLLLVGVLTRNNRGFIISL